MELTHCKFVQIAAHVLETSRADDLRNRLYVCLKTDIVRHGSYGNPANTLSHQERSPDGVTNERRSSCVDRPSASPADEQPSSLAEEQPSSPAEAQPSSPVEEQPSSPAEEQPSSPSEEQPSSPAEEQPSSPAEEQPSSPAEEQPSSPAEEQPLSGTRPKSPQLPKKLQHKHDFLSSLEIEGQKLSQLELKTIKNVTVGWELAHDNFEKIRETLTTWKTTPGKFWALPFSQTTATSPSLTAECYRSLNFRRDKQDVIRQRIYMEIVQIDIFNKVGAEPLDEIMKGKAMHEIASEVSQYEHDKKFEQILKDISTYGARGERISSLGLGTHFVLKGTREYDVQLSFDLQELTSTVSSGRGSRIGKPLPLQAM